MMTIKECELTIASLKIIEWRFDWVNFNDIDFKEISKTSDWLHDDKKHTEHYRLPGISLRSDNYLTQ